MNYPILIVDEPHMVRLIRKVVMEYQEVTDDQPSKGKKSPLMSKQAIYKKVGRTLADRAISCGSLKLSHINGRDCIKATDFDDWLSRAITI